MNAENRPLRLVTYLVPGIPLGLYQVYQHYLEEALGCRCLLSLESRWSGPPSGRIDEFTNDDADIGFICCTSYLRLKKAAGDKIRLLGVAPIHIHPKSELRPVFFAEIITRKEREDIFKTFYDLKGHRWAYNDDESLSGNVCVRMELRKMGFDMDFFSHTIQSGSHHNSLEMIRNGSADVAAVDSSTWINWLKTHPEDKDEFHNVCTLGPFPVQPVIVNTRLPDDKVQKIQNALLSINKFPEWRDRLSEFSVWGFKPIDGAEYHKDEEEMWRVMNSQHAKKPYY